MTQMDRTAEVHIVFHGYSHGPYNLQGVNRILGRFDQVMISGGNNWLFQENFGTTPERAAKFEQQTRRVGYAAQMIGEVYTKIDKTKQLTASQADSIGRKLRGIDLKRAIERGLVPPEGIRAIYYGIGLDDLKKRKPFLLKFEEQEQGLLDEQTILAEQSTSHDGLRKRALENLDVDGALEHDEKSKMFDFKVGVLRHPRIIFNTKKISHDIVRFSKGGVIYLPFGSHHEYVIDQMQDDPALADVASFERTISHDTPWDRPFSDYGRLGRQPQFTEDLLLRGLSERIAIGFLIDVANKQKQTHKLALNYEDINDNLVSIITTANLGELREFLGVARKVDHPFYSKVTGLLAA